MRHSVPANVPRWEEKQAQLCFHIVSVAPRMQPLPLERNESINSPFPSIDTHASFNDIQLFSCSLFLLFVSLVWFPLHMVLPTVHSGEASMLYATTDDRLFASSSLGCSWCHFLIIRLLLCEVLGHNRSKEAKCPPKDNLPEGQPDAVNTPNKSTVDRAAWRRSSPLAYYLSSCLFCYSKYCFITLKKNNKQPRGRL